MGIYADTTNYLCFTFNNFNLNIPLKLKFIFFLAVRHFRLKFASPPAFCVRQICLKHVAKIRHFLNMMQILSK